MINKRIQKQTMAGRPPVDPMLFMYNEQKKKLETSLKMHNDQVLAAQKKA